MIGITLANIGQTMYKFPIWHWHIENSSICSLKCPRCPRAEIPDTLVQTSLGLKFFITNFSSSFLQDVWQISFCGDDGDPIYGKEFLEIVEYLKTAKPNLSLRIITNGSYRNEAWWKKLAANLNQYDEIHFSLDGWDQESNQKYRVNSDWDSITTAIRTVRENSKVIMTWAAIAFKYNQYDIMTMKDLAFKWNFDTFQITYSTKFGSKYSNYNTNGNDDLEPNQQYVAKGHRFERQIINLSNRKLLDNGKNFINEDLYTNINRFSDIIPLCKIGNKGLYISSEGYFYPCCWMANRYNHTRWKEFRQPQYNLNTRNIGDILGDKMWDNFFNNLKNYDECKNKCCSQNFNKGYATSW
jgi:MoaA/NifB/PqqE/SkfB family radical SAM enzyme